MAVSEAIRRLRNTGVPESAVIGIDPGHEPGIAVVANGIVEAVYRVPLGQASKIVECIQQTYPDILVRIGNGARLTSTHLANVLISHGIAVEFVDESGTSPYLGKGTAGIASQTSLPQSTSHTRMALPRDIKTCSLRRVKSGVFKRGPESSRKVEQQFRESLPKG
jgi:hypothetical protein